MGRFLGPRHVPWRLPYPRWICDSGRAFIGFMGDSDHWQGVETGTISTVPCWCKKFSAFLHHIQLWPVESIQQQGDDLLKLHGQVLRRGIRLCSGSENSDNQGLEETLKRTLRDVSLCELWIAMAFYCWVRWHSKVFAFQTNVRSPWTEGCQDHTFVTRWFGIIFL